jgi:ADP-heptose:LPS heptosyltransferase
VLRGVTAWSVDSMIEPSRPTDSSASGEVGGVRLRGGPLRLARGGRRIARQAAARAMNGVVALGAASSAARAAPRHPDSVFVLRNNDIGDLLVVTPLFECLRRRFPDARIVAGVSSWSREALAGNPHLSEAVDVDAPWFNREAERWPTTLRRIAFLGSPAALRLRSYHFDVGIDVLGSAWGALLMMRAGVSYRVGVSGYAGGEPGFHAAIPFDPDEHVTRRALRQAALLGAGDADMPAERPQLFLNEDERAQGQRFWREMDARGGAPRLVLGPGAGVQARRWPHFVALAAMLPRIGPSSVAVLAGPRERGLAGAVAAACPTARAHCPPGLREVFAIVAASDLVVTNSSMLLHVAAAFGKPSIVLLGPSFSSAEQHQRQWGYPGLSLSCGREPAIRDSIYEPAEALQAIAQATPIQARECAT